MSPSADPTLDRGSSPTHSSVAVPSAGVLAAALVASLALAGCFGGGDGPAAGITSRTALEAARVEVQDNPDWTLVGVHAVETEEESTPSGWPTDSSFESEIAIGNGAAPQWRFVYVGGDTDPRSVVVSEGASETDPNRDMQQDEDPEPIVSTHYSGNNTGWGEELGSWSLTSEDTTEKAKRNETFDDIVSFADDGTLEHRLQARNGTDGLVRTWTLVASSQEEGKTVTVRIDADSGEVRDVSVRST